MRPRWELLETLLAALLLVAILVLYCWLPRAEGQSYTYPKPRVDSGLDLPLPPVRLGDPPAPPTLAPPPLPGSDEDDDPRDTPPPVFYGEQIDTEADSIVYVIDQSCSMILGAGTPEGSRLERAKRELLRSINALPESFHFNVVSFDCGVCVLSPALLEATDANKRRAAAWARGMLPTGATGTGPAVSLSLRWAENANVVLLTDGAPNCGVPEVYEWLASTPGIAPQQCEERFFAAHRAMIRRANTHGATIDVFGIQAVRGYRAFCQAVASDSGGSYHDVP